MRTSCINHPTNEPLIVIREWQVEACNNNHCAAALLSFFEYWHNIKLETKSKARHANDIAERHGDPRTQDESLIQFHSEQDLIKGLIGLYKRDSIRVAISILVENGFIEIRQNPNPRFAFDRTRYFEFMPDVVNSFLDSRKIDHRNRKTNDRNRKTNDRDRKIDNGHRKTDNDLYTEITYRDYLSEITYENSDSGVKPPTPKPESANADRVLAPDPWNSQTAPMPATRKASDPEPSAVEPEPELDVIQGELVEPIPANPLSGQNQGSGKDNSSAANLSKKKKEKFTAEQFNVWWQAVGHKEGKADARKVFLGLSPADVSLETLIEARQAQERWHVEHNGTLQYLKRPPAWLRAEAWDDQMEPVSSAGYSPEAIKQAKHADAIKQRILAKQASQSLR